MKKIFNKIMAGGALAIAATACTGDYLDINSNQFQPGDLTADGYLLASSMNNIFSSVISSDPNQTQFTDCLLGGTLGGYFAEGSDWGGTFGNNNAPDNWCAVLMKADQFIPTLYTNYSTVEAYCENQGKTVPLAVAKIVRVLTMSRITDTYGPIPFSEIGADGVIKTPYDSQQDIYSAFFAELAEARQMLQNAISDDTDMLNSIADNVYSGDKANWIRFANSLQLRLAMRIVYADPTLAKQKAEEAVNPANGGVIESNDQNATWKNYATATNPMNTAIFWNANDSRPSAEIICYLKGYNDPRLPKYVSKANSDPNGPALKDLNGNPIDYVGIRRGWQVFNAQWSISYSGIIYPASNPALWQNAAEVSFLRAEGAGVFKWNMGGTAESFYNNGIRLSFENYGVADAYDSYVADATSVPAAYYDPMQLNSWNGTLDPVTIKWDESLTPEQKQQKIITQKWIANWTLGNEAWADYRRTGYPDFIPVAKNASSVVNANIGPRRLPYPAAEYTNNLENVQKAVNDYLKGPDNLATPMWWDCKPGL